MMLNVAAVSELVTIEALPVTADAMA